MRRDQQRFRGVTMLELLIVLAVLALTLSIILPSVSYGHKEAVKTRCLGNLKQLIATATLYAHNDPKTIIGPVHPQAPTYVGAGYADYGGGPGTMNLMGWYEDFDPQTRPINHLLLGKGGVVNTGGPGQCPQFEVFRCPGEDLGWQEWPGFTSDPRETESPYFVANGTSYRMNNLAYTFGFTVGIPGQSLTRIPEPGLTVAFMEARAFQTIWTSEVWGYTTPGELTGYHGLLGYFNVAYVDGHASFTDFGLGTYYEHASFPFHPEYQGLDVRGTWGRMDCLPEPPVGFYRGRLRATPPPDGGWRPTPTMTPAGDRDSD